MLLKPLNRLTDEIRRKIHSFALGTTLAMGVVFAGQVSQSCAISGQ